MDTSIGRAEPAWPAIEKKATISGGIQAKIVLSSGEERTDFTPYSSLFTALLGPSGAGAMFRKAPNVKQFLGGSRCRLFIAALPRADEILVVEGDSVALLSRRSIGGAGFGLPPAEAIRAALDSPDVPRRSFDSLRELVR